MRNFNTKFRLRDTDRQIRLVYTWFLILMLGGFVFTIYWAHELTGLTPKGIAGHYRGSDATFGNPMPFHQLSETTHFHLFTMPVVFLIMAHVLYLTSASNRMKIVTTWLAFIGVSLDLISPWLISYVSPLFVLSLLTADILMTISFVPMFVIPMYEMWFLKQPLVMRGDHN